jgi:hypothetical protein
LLKLFIFIFLWQGCSTGNQYIQDLKETKRDDKSFSKDFKKSESILAKYSTPKKKPETKKVVKKKVVVHAPPVPKPQKKTIKKKVAPVKIIKPKGPQLPSDYPEKLKSLNDQTLEYWSKVQPPFYEGEKIYMDISYLGVTAGKIMLESKGVAELAGREAYHLHARVKSAPFYKFIYEVDDTLDSYLDRTSWLPLKYSLIQRESKQDIDDVQIYDHEKHKTYFFYRRVTKKSKSKKSKEKYTPIRFQDAFSVMHFLRGLPMVVGKLYVIPMVNKAEVLLMKAKVVKEEWVQTKLGKKRAFRIEAQTQTTGKTFKSDKLKFWYSSDARRIFLKFQAEVQIGAISGEIEKYVK